MSFINSSGRFSSITVGGSTFSQELIHFECGEDEVSESGIVFCQGTVKLQETTADTTPFSLDDRTNTAFAKGSEVVITVENADFHRSIMWVREAHYDLKERIQTLQICDLLSLLSGKDFGDKSKVCVGTPTAVFVIINNLLASVGAPALIDPIPGIIDYPVQGDNPISLAGQLAWSAGYILYMNKRNVRAKAAKFVPGGSAKGVDQILDYDRLSTGELPPAEIVITGEVESVKLNILNNRIYSRSWGIDFWSETIGSGSGSYRSVITTLQERGEKIMPWYFEGKAGGLIFSQLKVEEYEYETRAIANKPNDGDCNDNIERYLKRKTTTSLRPFGVVLREWILLHELDKNKNITYLNIFGGKATVYSDYFALITEEKEVVEYSFAYPGGAYALSTALSQSDFEVISDESNNNNNLIVQKIVTTKSKPGGSIFAKPFKLTGKKITHPEQLVPSEYQEESWKATGGEYHHYKLEMTSFASHDSAAAEGLYKQDEEGNLILSVSAYLGLIVARQDLDLSGSGSTQPPSPETAPPEHEISNSQKTFKAKVRSRYAVNQYSPPPQEYTIPWVFAGNETSWKAQAENVGNIMMGLAWGRYKGVEITDELFGSYEPLTPFRLQEPNGIYSYISDGFAVSVTRDQCLCRYVGLLVGNIGGSWSFSATSSGTTAGVVALTVPIVRDINPGTTVVVGGTRSAVATTLVAALTSGVTEIAIANPTTVTLSAGTILEVGGGQVVLRVDVSPGSTSLPIYASTFAAAAGSSIQYQQVTGGTPVTVTTLVPAGSTEISLGVNVASGTALNWIEQVTLEPFSLAKEIEANLLLYGGVREAVVTVSTEAVSGSLLLFGYLQRGTESVDKTLVITGDLSLVIPPENILGSLYLFGRIISYPGPLTGNRLRSLSFTYQTVFPLELGAFTKIDQIRIIVWDAFSSGTTISVGDATNQQLFVTTTDLAVTSAQNTLEINPGYQYASPTLVYLYLTGTSTTGSGTIYILQG